MPAKRKATDKQLSEAYEELGSVWEVGKRFGMCGQSVHERLQKLGIDTSENKWSEEDISVLARFYTERIFIPKDTFGLEDLATLLGRHKTNICRKARELGLTDINRRMSTEQKALHSSRMKSWIQDNGHQKGMLGKKHSDAMRQQMSERVKGMWEGNCESFMDGSSVMRALHTRHENGTLYPRRSKCTWKSGKRLIGDREVFFRSSWEANYARYLQFLQDFGMIFNWEFEVDTFWFDKVPRGTRSYLPDFKIWLDSSSFFYVETKGWMDDKSATKLKRMQEYYPEILVKVVRRKELLNIEDTFGRAIPMWEFMRSGSGERRSKKLAKLDAALLQELT